MKGIAGLVIASFVGLGMVVGLASALGGIGGGSLIMPAFIICFRDQFKDMKMVIGTSLAAVVFISISAAVGHWKHGNVNLQAAVVIGLAGVISAYLGAGVASRLPDKVLQRIVGTLLIFAGIFIAFIRPWLDGIEARRALENGSRAPAAVSSRDEPSEP